MHNNIEVIYDGVILVLKGVSLTVMIYRKHVAHESPKNFQLDLFTPDDGHYEYAFN